MARHAPGSCAGILLAALLAAPAASADRVDDLARMLQTESSYKARTQAALVLGKLGDARAVPVLLGSLHDDNEAVRAAAASSLGKLGDARARSALEAAQSDGSPIVRGAAQRALAQLASGGGAGPSRPSAGGARFLVSVSVGGKASPVALKQLNQALAAGVSKLPQVTTDGGPSGRLSAWQLQGTVTNLKLSGHRLDCDAEVAIVAMPAKAVRARASSSVSVDGVGRADDPGALHDCMQGAADQLTEEVGRFFKTLP